MLNEWERRGWRDDVILDLKYDELATQARTAADGQPRLSGDCLDSQSIKNILGCVCHHVVDSRRAIRGLFVQPANSTDRAGSSPACWKRWLAAAPAATLDGRSLHRGVGTLGCRAWQSLGDRGQEPEPRGYSVLPKRWIVERTTAWLGKRRRIGTDYEHWIASSKAMIRLAMAGLMLRRLRPAG